jgi:biotin carboxylase
VLALESLPRSVNSASGFSVIDGSDTPLTSAAVTQRVIHEATRLNVEGLVTLSEFSVNSVALAAEKLGLPGAGQNSARARDKRQMREAWTNAGVACPRFRPVRDEAGLLNAFRELNPPLLLKAAWGTGSVGQVIVEHESDVPAAWNAARQALAAAYDAGFAQLQEPGALDDFLVEEIIQGSIRTWWPEGSGYGDYLSVEGIVCDGVYHPVCITSRIPTIPPFTELSNLAPCELAEPLQRKIEAVACAAVNALELENCGTHTEMKLMDNGELSVLETAARYGGVMVLPEIEHVYGVDMVAALTAILLGDKPDLPARMLTDADASGAAGSLSLIATDANGRPWQRRPIWDSTVIDWKRLLSPGSTARVVPGLSIRDGDPMPVYDNASGARGYGGIFFVQASDAGTLVHDCYSILNGLERELSYGWDRRNGK